VRCLDTPLPQNVNGCCAKYLSPRIVARTIPGLVDEVGSVVSFRGAGSSKTDASAKNIEIPATLPLMGRGWRGANLPLARGGRAS
jgi:hypothetical protein